MRPLLIEPKRSEVPAHAGNVLRGFSLVELSIVLVILGLLVGGVLGGQSLIKAAELRTIITDVDKYKVAINAFKLKYNAVPGDMSNAADYWGQISGNCYTVQGTNTQTCNGNGDGIIGGDHEMIRAWQHLSNAGLVEGNYTGVSGTTMSDIQAKPGTNLPASKINGGGWSLLDRGTRTSTDDDYFEGSYKNVLLLGSVLPIGTATGANITSGGLIAPEDAFSVDSKIDDGKPATGNSLTLRSHTNCNTTTLAATAKYDLTKSGAACGLIFKLGY